MYIHITLTDNVKSFSDYIEVKEKNENGTVLGEYKMTLTALSNALSNTCTSNIKSITPFLPKNCIKLVKTNNGYEVFIELPKRKWPITYLDKNMFVGFPRLVCKYTLSLSRIIKFKIIAVKDKGPINSNTDIYYFPYSNVDHRTADVCMGTNIFPEIESIVQLEQVHHLFFAAPFGDDYGSAAIGKSLHELMDIHQNKEFDDDLLIPSQKSFKEFFELEE